MTTAISVENLGKRYRIGHEVKRATTKREALTNAVQAPFRYLKYRLSEATDEDTLWALKDVSFEVKQGEVLGIIGANGAGKSTLLKILSRITDPSEGRAEIRGRVNALLEVGVGFHPELTGRENVYLNAALHGLTTRETRSRLDEIVDFSGVERFLDTPVKRYSSGMKVRLGFAVAANLEPEILIVDEVLAVGDVSFQRKCLGKMEDVTKQGRTVLFVSHNMEAMAAMCSRCILLEGGTVKVDGSTAEAIEQYVNAAASQGHVLLRDRKDRAGEGRLRFTDTWVEDEAGERVRSVASGGKVKIVAEYEMQAGETVKDVTVAFGLNTARNVQFADLANSFTGDFFPGIIPARGRVVCAVERLPLNAGQYTYSVIARSSARVVEDYVLDAGTFNVHAGHFYKTGRVPNESRFMLMDHQWMLKDA